MQGLGGTSPEQLLRLPTVPFRVGYYTTLYVFRITELLQAVFWLRMHLPMPKPSSDDMSQVGGGVSTRSSARKAIQARAESPLSPIVGLQRSITNAQHSLATSSVSSHLRRASPMPQFPDLHLSPFPQPMFSVTSGQPKEASLDLRDDEDFFGRGASPSPPSRTPLATVVLGPPVPAEEHAFTDDTHTGHPVVSPHEEGGDGPIHVPPQNVNAPVLQRKASPVTGIGGPLPPIPEGGDVILIPSFFPLLASRIPEGFNTLAAQTPAHDEVIGSRCDYSFDGEEEDFDASPSRQRAGRIPNDHKEIIDSGIGEIDEIFLRMHKETGRTVTNLQNHYLASKGLKRTTRSIWNKYQRYFSANRVQERAACGDENAECKDAFLHFQNRFTNWREILSQVDEIITQEEACASGYRRRTAFNQAVQKLKTFVRINHQTHGFQTFTVIMGNQPNTDQNLFSIIESPAHVVNFRSQQETGNSGGPSSQPVELAGLLTYPTRKELPAENKQTKLVVPTAPVRSASVLSNSSTSDGNSDTALRNTIRDYFHTKLKLVNVTISSSSFPWKQLDRTLVSQGAVILNYPNDVPFPNLSSDPTYNGPPCKAEGGRNGTGIRKIGIAAMRRLASRCHDGEDGLRFIGGYSKHLIETSEVPWIVGPVPSDASGTIRCLYYDGSAKWVPRQALPVDWVINVKHETPPTPKASKAPIQVVPHHDLSPSPSRSSTPTPVRAKESACLSPLPPPVSTRFSSPPPGNRGDILPSPTPRAAKQPVSLSTPTPPPANHPTLSKSINPLANLHSHPRARIASARRTSSTTIEPTSAGSQERSLVNGVVHNPSKVSPIHSSNPTTSKRALEDSGSDTRTLSSKRLKSLSPDPSHTEDAGAGALPTVPAVLSPSASHLHSRQPSLPLEAGSSLPALKPVSKEQAPISSSVPSDQEIKLQEGLNSTAIPINVNNPAIPLDVSQTSDHSGLQVPPSMHQSSYVQPAWQSGYGGYPLYGHHPYYPPPPPQWGYPDGRPNYYQQESQRDGQTTVPSAMQSPPSGAYPFQQPEFVTGSSNRPMHPPPFYGRHDGPVYPPPYHSRFGSAPPAGFEQYSHTPPHFPPPSGMPPPPGHSNMPPPSG
ncbi:hypothetical protein BKA70DRAFT_1236038 [Coprinopsis sp. MPI-PUGE-AT-0042]|nr:hypothetical protein BKA70DRAFT_1236038 [Coprinopsis sp. MPI-PUGE-AT-0042]